MKRSEALEEIRKVLAMNGKDDGMGELEAMKTSSLHDDMRTVKFMVVIVKLGL